MKIKKHYLKRIVALVWLLSIIHVAIGQNNNSNSTVNWKAQWVTATEQQNETNNWTAYNKTFKVSQLPNLERYEYFEIDNYPGLITDSRNDIASSYVTSISIFVDSYNFQIQMGGSKKTRDDYKNLLYKMAASVVFTDY